MRVSVPYRYRPYSYEANHTANTTLLKYKLLFLAFVKYSSH